MYFLLMTPVAVHLQAGCVKITSFVSGDLGFIETKLSSRGFPLGNAHSMRSWNLKLSQVMFCQKAVEKRMRRKRVTWFLRAVKMTCNLGTNLSHDAPVTLHNIFVHKNGAIIIFIQASLRYFCKSFIKNAMKYSR